MTDGTGNTTAVPGAVGFAAVLLEENNVPDNAAEAGHQALNAFIASTVENFVTGLDLNALSAAVDALVVRGASRDDAMASEFKQKFAGLAKIIQDGASDVVVAAIRNEMGIAEAIWAVIDKDELMGTPVFHLVTARELLRDQNFSIAFTDQIYEKGVPQIEASRYLHDLHSEVGAYLRWRSLPSELPSAHAVTILATKLSNSSLSIISPRYPSDPILLNECRSITELPR